MYSSAAASRSRRFSGVKGGQDFYVMMNRVALAHHENRHHRRTSRNRQPRDAVAGRCRQSEKIDEHALAHVEVECNGDHPVLPQHPHHLAPARLALDDVVAVADALGTDGGVNERVAQRAMHDGEPVTVDRLRNLHQLEISEVRGQHEQAAAVGARSASSQFSLPS